jgi:hypothetical protein
MPLRVGKRTRFAAPVPLEKVVQAQGLTLLRTVGGQPYSLGTRRRRREQDHGSRQTPGIPDVWAFLPAPRHPRTSAWTFGIALVPMGLWWEAKRAIGGRMSDAQEEFQGQCQVCGVAHVVGDLDALVAFLIAGGWLLEQNVAHYRRPSKG